jgi:hypothetical protein
MAETATVGPPIQLRVINISEASPTVGKAMIDAAAKYGFLYVDSEGCGIPPEDVELAFDMVRRESLLYNPGRYYRSTAWIRGEL